jgi:4-hydroxybenzoyl-CoA thioesterase
MRRVDPYAITVEFGDCDPAGIVFYPNFSRWLDSACRWFFTRCGVPPWRETEASHGILGTPIVHSTVRFMRPATYGDRLVIDTAIRQWKHRSFVVEHAIHRDEEVLVRATEVRVFARRIPGDLHRIEAVPIPDFIRELCDDPQ